MKSTAQSIYDHAGYLVKRLQHSLRGQMDKGLRAIDLSTAQYALLCAIEATSGASGAELARRCFITPQSVSEIIVTMEKSRLVTRTASPTHGRILGITLTAAGRSQLKAAHHIVAEVEARMLKGLNKVQQKELAAMLRQCIEGLGDSQG